MKKKASKYFTQKASLWIAHMQFANFVQELPVKESRTTVNYSLYIDLYNFSNHINIENNHL